MTTGAGVVTGFTDFLRFIFLQQYRQAVQRIQQEQYLHEREPSLYVHSPDTVRIRRTPEIDTIIIPGRIGFCFSVL